MADLAFVETFVEALLVEGASFLAADLVAFPLKEVQLVEAAFLAVLVVDHLVH